MRPAAMGPFFQVNLHGIVAFGAASYAVNENAASVTLTVNRTGSTAGAIAVNYATVDGTAGRGRRLCFAHGVL